MSARPDTPDTDLMADAREIVVYIRPGCPYCFTLRAGLHRAGLTFREINIWADPDAAAFVRSVANGNETVPTVVVGDPFPDIELVDHEGRSWRTAEMRGRPLVLILHRHLA